MSRFSALYETFLRKPPRQARSRSVVEAILRGAADLVAQGRTEEDVSVQDVADRAGVGIGSLYDYFRDHTSLLAAVTAKVTEENQKAFEAELDATLDLPLEETVGRIVDFCFARFVSNKPFGRAVMKIAHAVGAMPTVGESTNLASEALAAAMRKRSDIHVADIDLAGWVVTNTMLGAVHTILWQDAPRWSTEQLRADLVTLFCAYLRGGEAPAIRAAS